MVPSSEIIEDNSERISRVSSLFTRNVQYSNPLFFQKMMEVPTDYHGENHENNDGENFMAVELPDETLQRTIHDEEADRYKETNDNFQNSSNRTASVPDIDVVNDMQIVVESIPVHEGIVQTEVIEDEIKKSEERSVIATSNVGESQAVVPQDGIIEPPLSKAAARMRKYRAEHRRDKSWLAKEAERMRKIRAARKAAEPESTEGGKPKKYYAARKPKTVDSSTLLSEVGIGSSVSIQAGIFFNSNVHTYTYVCICIYKYACTYMDVFI
jgi:hypothetical protein